MLSWIVGGYKEGQAKTNGAGCSRWAGFAMRKKPGQWLHRAVLGPNPGEEAVGCGTDPAPALNPKG